MREIINISISHRSAHLITHFYNCQEELIHENPLINNPKIFLNQSVDKISKLVSYSPRLLLWDAKQGNGSLGTYQYSSPDDYHNCNENESIIQTRDRIRKPPYQIALDTNKTLPSLTDDIAVYWSDYNKLIYDQTNIHFLEKWHHNVENPSLPNFQNLETIKFDKYEIGFTEFRDSHSDDFFNDGVRIQVEKCDNIQGFNLITEVDNAWGGFSSSLLEELRDEFHKCDMFTWSFNDDDIISLKKSIRSLKVGILPSVNKIKSTLSLSQNSDLFFPMYSNQNSPLWHSTGNLLFLFDTVNSIFSESYEHASKSMNYLTNLLTIENKYRNIVSLMNTSREDYSFYTRMPYYNSKKAKLDSHTFHKCIITRSKDCEIPERLLTHNWLPSDTVPIEFHTNKDLYLNLAVTEKPRDVFKHWIDIIKYLKYDSEREELKEQLGMLASNYEYGWYDDDDSGDDL